MCLHAHCLRTMNLCLYRVRTWTQEASVYEQQAAESQISTGTVCVAAQPSLRICGREAPINDVMKHLLNGQAHLICVVGLPGIGKTEFVKAVQQEYPRRVSAEAFYINLDAACSIVMAMDL